MRKVLAELIVDPLGGELRSVRLSGDDENVYVGVLVNDRALRAYPVIDGVPVMFHNAYDQSFADKYDSQISKDQNLAKVKPGPAQKDRWAFDPQWVVHNDVEADRTWGQTVPERISQFLQEINTSIEDLKGTLVLDAGCGNGRLTEALSDLGCTVIGLDYSASVYAAEKRRKSDSVHFIRGDLQQPPFAPGSFDRIICIGVLMCTPDTVKTFNAVAALVKPGGKFYAWVYRRPEHFLGRYIKVPIYDFMRFVICRLPSTVQATVVRAYARLVRLSHNVRKGENPIPLHEYIVSAYDDMTPMWRRYHTPFEMSRWFRECGYSQQTMTHWDNPYGFGMVATKVPVDQVPGIHVGSGPKLWDNDRTLLGRLHAD